MHKKTAGGRAYSGGDGDVYHIGLRAALAAVS